MSKKYNTNSVPINGLTNIFAITLTADGTSPLTLMVKKSDGVTYIAQNEEGLASVERDAMALVNGSPDSMELAQSNPIFERNARTLYNEFYNSIPDPVAAL